MDHSKLFLERSRGEKILINEGPDQIELEVQRIRDHNVTLVFRGPRHVKIERKERVTSDV